MRKHLFQLFVYVCVFGGAAMALGQNARFSGQVTDQQNAAIPNANIRAINQDSHSVSESKSNGEGSYTIPFLPAGHYKIEVQASGFSPSMSEDISLNVGQAFIYNIQLTIGSTQSTVSVNAGSEVTQVNTENAEVGGTITGKEVS
ncbi:carboxypeptidase-like regulatory domain-containing protein, partial [Paracidobacterium acidisoli]